MTAPVVAVGGVVVRDGRVLLIRRGKPPLLGRWTIPGGAVELGEPLVAALVREMAEETGLSVRPQQVLTVAEKIEREGGSIAYHFVIVDYLCQWLAGEARAGSDAQDVSWVRAEELPAYDLTPKALEVVLDALRISDHDDSKRHQGSGGPSSLPPGGGLGAEPPE